MEFRTVVALPSMGFQIEPCDEVLCVGSCFAEGIGRHFRQEAFPVTVNPYGTMYNPASILHTVERCAVAPRVAFFTLGTNHVYRLKETGEIVDNCEKRPQRLFVEEQLSIEESADYLARAMVILRERNPEVEVVLTVSPIRYAKYGFHESQLSKATLLLATRRLAGTHYFPAYEIVLDELRDYRFYKPDMLHPSDQAVEYIWQRLIETCFSARAQQYMAEWRPLRETLAHRPFHPESEEYRTLIARTREKVMALKNKYPHMVLPEAIGMEKMEQLI